MIQSSLFQFTKDETKLDPNIILVDNWQWESCLDELKKAEYCGFDIETYGSQPEHALDPWKGSIRLIQVGLPSGKSLILDLQTKGFDSAKEAFLSILKDRFRNIICIGTHLKFDAKWMLVKYGITIYRPRCIGLMSRVLWAGVWAPKNEKFHSLKSIASRCQIPIDKSEQSIDWGGKLTNKSFNYAHNDVHIPIACCKKMIQWLRQEGCERSAMIECEAMPSFVEIECMGQPVNKERLDMTLQAYSKACNESIIPFSNEFPRVNPASPKEVKAALELKYGKEFEGTSDNILSTLKDPAFDALMEWRSFKTQVDRLNELCERYKDGAVCGQIQQIAGDAEECSGDMGRTSAKHPNWQNIGKLQPKWKRMGLPPIRAVVQAPKGYVFICADLSQAHARIACQVSKDPFLVKVYAEDYDVHSDMASALAEKRGLNWDAKSIKKWSKDDKHPNHTEAKSLRDAAKNCFYGSLNMQSAATLVATCAGSAEPIFITEDEAKYLIQLWRKKYSGVYSLQKNTIAQTNTQSHTPVSYECKEIYSRITGPTGRNLYLEKQPNKFQNGALSIKGTDCLSFVWMGAEADIIKQAMAIIFYERDSKWDLKFRNMAHDELNLTAKEEYAEPASKLVFEAMHRAMRTVVKIIPVDEDKATPDKLIIEDWSKK